MFDYNQFNSTYEVDLAILSAVTSGGGGGGGVTPQQVSTMIDSALTPYSTTSETEGMIQASAGTTTGQVQTQIDSALTAYSTTSQVEAMIAASGGSEGSYISVKSLSEITSPEEGMVANVIDWIDTASTVHLGTGEWQYDGTAWRPKKIWLERLTTAEKEAVWAWIWKRDSEAATYEEQFNLTKGCQVIWNDKHGYPAIITSNNVYTWEGNVVVWGSTTCGGDDADADRMFYISLDSGGTTNSGYRKIAKNKDKVWDALTITEDGTVSGGNGYWLYQACFSNDYEFGNPMEQIKCVASGQTYFGTFISTVRFENETDIWEATGVITIGDDTYVGVWGFDGNWMPYKKSFTQIEAGGGAGKTFVPIPWDNTAYTSTTIASLYADAEAIYQSGLSVNSVFEKYDIVLYDGIRQAMPCIFLKYVDGENRVQLGFINEENGLMIMYGSIYADGHSNIGGLSDITGSLQNKVQGQSIGTIRALTQQEYDDETYYEPTTLYIIKPNNQ